MKLITILIGCTLFLFISSTSHATTYYMANSPANKVGWGNGSDTNNGASKTTPFLTWSKARSVMAGGDTLIICDGTYTGTANMIDIYSAGQPPSGTAGAWTTIKAETDGAVTLDGQGVRVPVNLSGNTTVDNTTNGGPSCRYIEFRGILAANSSDNNWFIYHTDHIKLINCGSNEANGGSSGFNFFYSQYGLAEGCYAYGQGRYKFATYHADRIIFRNCVSRFDASLNASNPVGDYAIYSSKYCEVQNCIAIDGDQPDKVTNVIGGYGGSFYTPTTSARGDGDNQPNYFTNVISINNSMGFAQSTKTAYTSDMRINNAIGWNHTSRGDQSFVLARGDMTINNATFGSSTVASTPVIGAMLNGWTDGSNANTFTNSILTGFVGPLFYDIESASYNVLYGNTGSVTANGPAPTNTVSTNPFTSGLMYLPRIEPGSTLDAAGQGGTYIGAKIIQQYGKTGTLWGEEGYNLIQDGTNGQSNVSIWPFPNEDLIKEKMAAYSANGINGARGFASTTAKRIDGISPVTLTSYIWEYLGNPIPVDIYNDPITGTCGASNGLSLSSAPTIELCTAGTPSAVSGTGPWAWTCEGSGGGSTASCGATLLEIPSGGASAAVACSAIAGFR